MFGAEAGNRLVDRQGDVTKQPIEAPHNAFDVFVSSKKKAMGIHAHRLTAPRAEGGSGTIYKYRVPGHPKK